MTPNQTKQKQLLELLQEGPVMVFIDTRCPGVLVPERFRGEPDLKLNFDYAFRIPDFEVREDGLIATLSFSQTPHFCALPFESIWQMVNTKNQKNFAYPESFPLEMIHELLGQARRGLQVPPEMVELLQRALTLPRPEPQMLQNPPRPKNAKPSLSIVSEAPAETVEALHPAPEVETEPEPETTPEPPKRSHLKLVK
jgi:hypothetical protein